MQKCRNNKVTFDGHEFDSRKEANRYQELKLLQRAGKISDLQMQVPFQLIPPQFETFERFSTKTGKKLKDGRRCIEHGITYKADFVYMQDGIRIVEDVKGHRDPAAAAYARFVIIRKLMLWIHGIRIREV